MAPVCAPLLPVEAAGPLSAQCNLLSGQGCMVQQQQCPWTQRLKASLLDSLAAFALQQDQQQPQKQRPPCAARYESTGDAAAAVTAKRKSTLCLEEAWSPASHEPEYLEHCYADEAKALPVWHYLTTVQREITSHKRLILIDWLVEVCDEFKLSQATLFLTVNIVDRYLSRQSVPRATLQLLGVTALWIASKFEEVYPPTLADFVDVTSHTYTAKQLKSMEAEVLKELQFTLMVPTAVTFLTLFLPAAAANAADADAHLAAAIDGDGCESDDSSEASSSDISCYRKGGGSGGGKRLSVMDAPTGPRAAPCYPYPIGSPCEAFSAPAAAAKRGVAAAAAGEQAAAHATAAPVVPAGSLGDFPRRLAHLAEYLVELALLCPECLRFPPSLTAAAALNLACSILEAPPGTRARLAPAAEGCAAHAGPQGEERLRTCIAELRRMYLYAARAPQPPSVKYKYCSPKRSSVASAPVPRWLTEDS